MDDRRQHRWIGEDPATETEREAISRAWDAMVAGDSPRHRDLGPELTETLHRIDRLRNVPPPRRGFRTDLKEELMSTHALAAENASPFPGTVHGAASPRPLHGSTNGSFWTGTIPAVLATAALIAVTLGGLYYGLIRPGSDGPTPPTAGFAAVQSNATPDPAGTPDGTTNGTPNASPNDEAMNEVIVADDPLTAAFGDQPSWDAGRASIVVDEGGVFTAEDLDGQNVRVDDITLAAASTSTYGATDMGDATGFASDFILDGAYIAEFDAPVLVERTTWVLDSTPVTVIPAGQQVELVRGDSVSYPLGSKRALTNPMITTALRIKTVYVYDGTIPERIATDSTGWEVVGVEAITTMPAAAAGQFEGGTIYLNFLNTEEPVPADTVYENKILVAGPFGRTEGTKTLEQAGFYVWISLGFG